MVLRRRDERQNSVLRVSERTGAHRVQHLHQPLEPNLPLPDRGKNVVQRNLTQVFVRGQHSRRLQHTVPQPIHTTFQHVVLRLCRSNVKIVDELVESGQCFVSEG